jgi:osmotically-inducible protein OsmY
MRYVITIIALVSIPFLHGCAVVAVGAAAGGGYVVGEDPRPVAVMSEDQRTEFRIHDYVREKQSGAHINATSYNRAVLLTGEAPSEQAKADIERFARSIEGVRGIYNEIRIGGVSSMQARTNDTFITSKVKTRLLDSGKLNPIHIKVLTEAGTVYLLGTVKRQEANDATEIARTTSGVQRVVRVFEYPD